MITCAIFLSSCSATVHPITVPSKNEIRAHWIKKNEKAPFSGILLSTQAYKLLRSKIIECKYQLNMCLQEK